MIQVSGLSKSYATRTLFEDVSFSVNKGEIIGLVGRNGCGKSTLFRVIKGEEIADTGDVSIPKGYRLGSLDQHIHFTKNTVVDECCTVLEDPTEQYKAEAYLFGLGFEKNDLEKHPSTFSGGYQLRINLVKALLKEPDLLLLDEPTNYLDILSMAWMRNFLKSFPGEVIIITHDRSFMDSVVTHVMGIHRKHLKKIKGKTEKYYEQLWQEEEIYEQTRRNQEQKVKEMQKFVDRFRAKASKATQAQSKMKQIQKMTVLSALSREAELGFKFNFKPTPAKTLMTVKDLSFGFKETQLLFTNLSFRVNPEDRIAIIGKNGHGKTTLLNVIADQLKAKGEIYKHPETAIGYYQQTNKKDLSPEMTIYEEISSDNPELGITEVRAICGAMMFPGEVADKKIKVLSGGEMGRVLLGKVIAKQCNLLLLDEPTNHLDMESIQVMGEQIDEFPGGVLLVTHDETLLKQVATKLIVFKNGNARVFLGTYEEFLEKEGWEDGSQQKADKPKTDRKELKRKRAELIQERSRLTKPIKKEIDQLESQIIELEESLKDKNEKVAQMDLNTKEAQDIYQQIGKIQIDLATKYERLDELIVRLDQLTEEHDRQLKELE